MNNSLVTIILPMLNLLALGFLIYKAVMYWKAEKKIGLMLENTRIKITIVVCFLAWAIWNLWIQISLMLLHAHEAKLYEVAQGIGILAMCFIGIKIFCYFTKDNKRINTIPC